MDFTIPVLIALTAAVVQALKGLKIPTGWLPFLSVLVGVGFQYLAGTEVMMGQMVLTGVVIGLAGAGLFDFAKLTAGKVVVAAGNVVAKAIAKK